MLIFVTRQGAPLGEDFVALSAGKVPLLIGGGAAATCATARLKILLEPVNVRRSRES
jgi:hypothetical protein